jgi:hypothetical protein
VDKPQHERIGDRRLELWRGGGGCELWKHFELGNECG